MRPKISPGNTSKETSSTATVEPYRLPRWATVMTAVWTWSGVGRPPAAVTGWSWRDAACRYGTCDRGGSATRVELWFGVESELKLLPTIRFIRTAAIDLGRLSEWGLALLSSEERAAFDRLRLV